MGGNQGINCKSLTMRAKMSKMKALELQPDGSFDVTDGLRVIGGLLPTKSGMFKVRMGAYGGFYSTPHTFDEALDFLIGALISTHEVKLRRIKTGANLIYKKKYLVK